MPSWFRALSRRLGAREIALAIFGLAASGVAWWASEGRMTTRLSFGLAELCVLLLFIRFSFGPSTPGTRAGSLVEWGYAVIVDLAALGIVLSVVLAR